MFMKTKGEHNCGSCKCISNVVISRGAYALASAVCVLGLLTVVLYTLGGDHGSYMGIACVLAPFLIFYITIPFFVRLVPCKDKSAVNKLLEKRASAMPNETAFQAIQNASKPVTLDVEDDFSARFMMAKKNNIEKNAADLAEQGYEQSEGEPEDIGNTKIAFEISEDGFTENEDFKPDVPENRDEFADQFVYADSVAPEQYGEDESPMGYEETLGEYDESQYDEGPMRYEQDAETENGAAEEENNKYSEE